MDKQTGTELIAAERVRQIVEEGYTATRDQGRAGELMSAAICYSYVALSPASFKQGPPAGWPWKLKYWKPAESPERNLAKAGALIAAAIDSLKAGA